MKKPFIPSDYALSTYVNTTRVGLHKVKFDKRTIHWIEKAIDDVVRQVNDAHAAGVAPQKVESLIPYTVFPTIRKAISPFDKKHEPDFLILYYKHTPIGIIKEDIPLCIPICPVCHIALKSEIQEPTYLWWQKAVRVLFPKAYTPLYEHKLLVCKEHGYTEAKDILMV